MVKKWIIILSIVGILIAGCILEHNFVNDSFKFLEQKLEKYGYMLDADQEHVDSQENISYMTNLHKEWHKKNVILKSLIWHTGMKDIEIGLARITTYTEDNNYIEAETELDALIDYIQHYSKDFTLTLENFF